MTEKRVGQSPTLLKKPHDIKSGAKKNPRLTAGAKKNLDAVGYSFRMVILVLHWRSRSGSPPGQG